MMNENNAVSTKVEDTQETFYKDETELLRKLRLSKGIDPMKQE